MTRRRISTVAGILLGIIALIPAFAGGGTEQSADRGERRLDRAEPAPVEDISGYDVRFAAWWNGPDNLTLVGRETMRLWDRVEQNYDVNLEWIEVPNPDVIVEKLVATVLLGEPFADIIWINSWDAIPALVEANMILRLDNYIDFSDPRLDPSIVSTAMYDGHVYGFHPTKLGGGGGIWYNKSLFMREGFDDPYELQQRGEWDWDAFFEFAKAATKDTNLDGEIDQWGLTIGYEIEFPLIWSNGGRVVRETPDGYKFTMGESQTIEALEFISEIYDSGVVTYGGPQPFIAGNAALYFGYLFQGAEMAQNMHDEYGFIYWPKGPSVDDYVSMGTGGAVIVFPANVNYPPERLGRILLDQVPFDIARDVQMEFIEGQLADEHSIETVLNQMQRGGDTDMYLSFPGLQRWVGEILRSIRRGSSPATAVKEYQQPAQEAIDSLFR